MSKPYSRTERISNDSSSMKHREISDDSPALGALLDVHMVE